MKKKPLLGIDASRSTRDKPTGVENYSNEIIGALLPELSDFDVRLYTPQWIDRFPRALQKRIRFPRLWTLVRLSWEMITARPKLLFVPAHVLPFFPPLRTFITVHDIAFEKIPTAYPSVKRAYLRWSTKRALRKAYKVIVPTESVKKDILKFYHADAEKLVVIPHGLTPMPEVSKEEIAAFFEKHGLSKGEPLFFFIGRLETKKNLMTLLDAWSIVQKMYSKGRLVLAGMSGHGFEEIEARMKTLGDSVIAPGYITEKEASILYHSATCFIFPSREEGFGLPIIQAFDSGCLVIASDIPSLREVAGDAALFADVDHAKDFAEQMMRILEDAALRKKLKTAAKEQVKNYSWKKAAEKLASLFKEA